MSDKDPLFWLKESSDSLYTTETEDRWGTNSWMSVDVTRLTKDPQERRKQSQRVSLYFLLGFLVLVLVAFVLIGGKEKKSTGIEEHVGGGTRPLSEHIDWDGSISSHTVQCNGKGSYSLFQWLDQDLVPTTTLCDPEFRSKGTRNSDSDITKPVKVFVMMGEANMVGAGQVKGDFEGTLEYTVRRKQRFRHLVDGDGKSSVRPDVRYVAVDGDFNVHRNQWLSVSEEKDFFGPELQFGYVMGELLDEPVLLIKACSGHVSLGGDLLPPGSPRFEHEDYIYAGYGDSRRRWPKGTQPQPYSWYAGQVYDIDVANVKRVLGNIGTFYPGASSYDIAGFLWWHGDSDRRYPAYASQYERNLEALIHSLRDEFNAPNSKFAIATVGQGGEEMSGDTLVVHEAQLAVGTEKYPGFLGNVETADIRSSWKGAQKPGHTVNSEHRDPSHYGNNAETVLEVGNALGLTMAKLMIAG